MHRISFQTIKFIVLVAQFCLLNFSVRPEAVLATYKFNQSTITPAIIEITLETTNFWPSKVTPSLFHQDQLAANQLLIEEQSQSVTLPDDLTSSVNDENNDDEEDEDDQEDK